MSLNSKNGVNLVLTTKEAQSTSLSHTKDNCITLSVHL